MGKMQRDILFTSLCTTWAALLAILLLVWMDTYLLHYFYHGQYTLCGVMRHFTATSNQRGFSSEVSSEENTSFLIYKYSDKYFSYDNFYMKEPIFVNDTERTIFRLHNDNVATEGWRNDTMLQGRIITHRDGTIHTTHECGWNMNQGEFSKPIPPRRKPRMTFDLLCPLLVPNSNTFQHFVDGVLPKLAQIHDIVTQRQMNVTYLFYRPWDGIIHEMLAKIGIPPDRTKFYDGGYISARYLIDTCITPPIHPILWQRGRDLLGVEEHSSELTQEPLVILLTRYKARNIGRRILNMKEVTFYLKNKFGDRFHIFQDRPPPLDKTMMLFQRAAIVIGVHGGAFYNLIFCPRSTKVLEMMPVNEQGRPVPEHLAHTIIWQMAQVMNQTYLRMSLISSNDKGDIHLPLDRLNAALNKLSV